MKDKTYLISEIQKPDRANWSKYNTSHAYRKIPKTDVLLTAQIKAFPIIDFLLSSFRLKMRL